MPSWPVESDATASAAELVSRRRARRIAAWLPLDTSRVSRILNAALTTRGCATSLVRCPALARRSAGRIRGSCASRAASAWGAKQHVRVPSRTGGALAPCGRSVMRDSHRM
jgi:hypothetical protein